MTMMRARYSKLIGGVLAITTALVIAFTGGVLAVRFWEPWREHTIEETVLELRGVPFWWPSCWRNRYEVAEPIFRAAHDNNYPQIRVHVLALKKSAHGELVPLLTKTLDHPDRRYRAAAMLAIVNIGTEATGAMPAVIKALDDPDGRVRLLALVRIDNEGPPAAEAVLGLERFLADEQNGEDFRCVAAKLLGEVGPASVPVLVRHLRDDQLRVRWAVIKAIGSIGPGAHEAIPSLREVAAWDIQDQSLVEAALKQILRDGQQ
jgi:HEAT repeat protein